jgi:glycosyltransferase involved in cell wall biosynthesis
VIPAPSAVASIVIPTFEHAKYLPAAIESALLQSVRCEVVVVDDGSTDATGAILARYAGTIKAIRQPRNYGVAAARNTGMQVAGGEYLMFLDADDTIEPKKIERQIAEFARWPSSGWVLCDVQIIDTVGGLDQLASRRYGYADMALIGWIGGLLAKRNFIPVHSPLIKRTAIGSARFPVGQALEDWAFWRDLADIASVRYVPEVLATYFKRPTGRNSQKRATCH